MGNFCYFSISQLSIRYQFSLITDSIWRKNVNVCHDTKDKGIVDIAISKHVTVTHANNDSNQ